jgi:hypothetical protein
MTSLIVLNTIRNTMTIMKIEDMGMDTDNARRSHSSKNCLIKD